MPELWVIIRSEELIDEADYEPDAPTVCGIYKTKEEAVEEILKLCIEDDIDLVGDLDDSSSSSSEEPPREGKKEGNNKGSNKGKKEEKGYDYRPTVEGVKNVRQKLLEDEYYSVQSNLGNRYSLVNCTVGTKHEFGANVVALYKETLRKH